MHEYITKGICAKKIRFDLREGRVYQISFENGCEGNLKALAILAEGMLATDLVQKLKGNTCLDKPTSCADQLALAVEKFL